MAVVHLVFAYNLEVILIINIRGHCAMIESYLISIIDNARDSCFSNLTNMTIAKIPSAHVHILCRQHSCCSRFRGRLRPSFWILIVLVIVKNNRSLVTERTTGFYD